MNKKNKFIFFNILNSNFIKSLKRRFDKNNMFKSISDFKNQIIKSFDIESKWYIENQKKINNFSNDIDSVLICGMGGSAIGGELAKIMLSDDTIVPISINRSSTIPNWVNNKTLILILSYSGNTYETIESFYKSIKKSKKIIAISSNSGIINNLCSKYKCPIVNIASGLQPRCALGYISAITILILIRLGLTKSSRRIKQQIKESVRELNHVDRELNNNNDSILSISYKIKKSIPIIYGFENTTSIAALRFKNQLQENAKILSFSNSFPEINHNEIESWHHNSDNFFILWINDSFISEKDAKAFNAAFNLIESFNINQQVIELTNKYTSDNNKIAKLYKTIYYLDWISYYVALLNNTSPISINNIKSIKKSIK